MSTQDWADVAFAVYLLVYGLCWGFPIVWWTRRLVREKTRTAAPGVDEPQAPEFTPRAGPAREPEEDAPAPPRVLPRDRGTEVQWPSDASERAFERALSWRSDLARFRLWRFLWGFAVLFAALGIAEWQEWFGPHAGGTEEVSGRWVAITLGFLGVLLVVLAGGLVDRVLSRRTLHHNRTLGHRTVFGGGCLLLKLGLAAFAAWLLDPERIPHVVSGGVALLIVLAPYFLVRSRSGGEGTIPRVDLLILRVFGTGRANYVYSKVEPLWERVGSVFTLASGDFAVLERLRISARSWAPILVFLVGPAIVVGLIASSLYLAGDLPMWVIVATAVAHGALMVVATRRPMERLVERSFIASPESVPTELARLWKGVDRRRPGGAYRHRHLTCTAATWRPVVSALLDRCGAVLVDFRGCRSENLGLRYELRLAFRKVPVETILILVDDGMDATLLSETLENAWSGMDRTSPNWESSGEIKVFRSRKKMRTPEARRVVAWLFRDAVAPGAGLARDRQDRRPSPWDTPRPWPGST